MGDGGLRGLPVALRWSPAEAEQPDTFSCRHCETSVWQKRSPQQWKLLSIPQTLDRAQFQTEAVQVKVRGSGGSTWAESSPRTSSPWPPWTGSWSAWSCCSGSPWRCGNTRSPPGSPSCPRSGTGWCGGAGRCRAAGPGCKGGCSSAPPSGSDTDEPPGNTNRWTPPGWRKSRGFYSLCRVTASRVQF